VIAGVLILVVAYFLFQSTLIVSPLSGDIVDVQIRQYGLDALNILSNPQSDANDTLENSIAKLNSSVYPTELLNSLDTILPDNLEYNLEIAYFNITTNQTGIYPITNKSNPPDTVTATKIIVLRNGQLVSDSPFKVPVNYTDIESVSNSEFPVVLEVRLILWRI
jgi:hypothetical protein